MTEVAAAGHEQPVHCAHHVAVPVRAPRDRPLVGFLHRLSQHAVRAFQALVAALFASVHYDYAITRTVLTARQPFLWLTERVETPALATTARGPAASAHLWAWHDRASAA